MNKVTKGALAAAAGAAILAGGAGTMAAWNSSTTSSGGGTVTAGSLNVTQAPGTGVWKWANGIKDGEAVNFTTDRIVPGDELEYTATYNVTLSGTNLKAELVPSLAGVTGDLKTNNLLDVSTSSGDTVQVSASGPVEVTSTVTFKSSTVNQDGMNQTASLAGASVVLTQKL